MKLSKYKITIIGLAISIIILLLAHFFDLDLFEEFVAFIERHEEYELDELIIPIIIFLISISINILFINRDKSLKIEKYKIFRAMLNSLHHIINNFLNQAQIVKLEAEKSRDFNKEILDIYENIIDEASELTKALESVDTIDAESIRDSVKPK